MEFVRKIAYVLVILRVVNDPCVARVGAIFSVRRAREALFHEANGKLDQRVDRANCHYERKSAKNLPVIIRSRLTQHLPRAHWLNIVGRRTFTETYDCVPYRHDAHFRRKTIDVLS